MIDSAGGFEKFTERPDARDGLAECRPRAGRERFGSPPAKRVALVDWSHVVDDFLTSLGLSFAEFRDETTGGWMFGYIAALAAVDCDAVLYCFSDRIDRTERHRHAKTGAEICLLPSPGAYRWTRRRIPNPYATTVEEASGESRGLRRVYLSALKHLAPYLATPVVALAREISRDRCSAILCQEYESARFDVCVALGRLLSIPVSATFQGGNWQLSRLERFVRPVSVSMCRGLIVASSGEAERVEREYLLPATVVSRVFNPLDVAMRDGIERESSRQALGIPARSRVVVWHGRLDMQRKGLDVLLDAWRQIECSPREWDVRLIVLGTGRDRERFGRAIESLRLRNVVWIDRYVNDRELIARYLTAADVYAFPSRHEGFPVAPIEGMACGLPLVAASAPGIRDILAEGEASGGVIVAPGEAEPFARELARLLADAELCERLGAAARRRVESRFSLASVGEQLVAALFS